MARPLLALLALIACGKDEPDAPGRKTTPGSVPLPAQCAGDVAAINGLGAYLHVGEALVHAEAGDVVVICPGTWEVEESVGTGAIAIRGQTGDPADVVLVTAAGRGTVLVFGRSTTITLQHLTLTGATTSAVTVADATDMLVENCIFEGNQSEAGGGAIAALIGGGSGDGPHLRIRGSAFTGNQAPNGGALELVLHDDARVTIEDSTFEANTADVGGAVHVLPISGSATETVFENTTFTDNAAARDGGAAAVYGPGLVRWTGTVATGNTAGNAGAAYLMAPTSGGSNLAFLETGVIAGNVADGVLSGAVHLEPGWQFTASAIDFGGTADPNLPKDVNVCPSVDGWDRFTVDNGGCRQTSR